MFFVLFQNRHVLMLFNDMIADQVKVRGQFRPLVPLAAGGLNDVSKIRLLCSECNSKKRAGTPVTSNHYEAWYREDEQ